MQSLPPQVVSRKFYRRILPGLRRLKHIRSIIIRNVKNDSVEESCQLFFTIHCKLHKNEDSTAQEEESLVYTSEVVEDTVNPEWNEFGNPVDIIKEAKDETTFTLRVWNKKETKDDLIIESVISIQDLDYLAPLESVDISSMSDIKSIAPAEMELIRDNMSTAAVEQIFNALPLNAVLFHMTDGYFTSHPVSSLLRRNGVLKSIDAPIIDGCPAGSHICDFHFTLTSLQQLYLQQSRTQQNDDRMSLMKQMVEESMSGPMIANEQAVASKCLMNDIKQLKEEQALLQNHLDEETKIVQDLKTELTESRQTLQNHYETVANYEDAVKEKEDIITSLHEKDNKIRQCLQARRTRLLAMLSFLFPISQPSSMYAIKGMKLEEITLRTTGQLSESQYNETNAALGYLTHLITILAKYFNVSLPYTTEYRSSLSVIYNPNEEPPVHHPVFVGSNTKDGDIRIAMSMMRGNVQKILDCENIKLEIDEDMLSGLDKLFKRFDPSVTLETLREMNQTFATERDWDQFHSPRNLLLAMVGEVGELCEILQWKGEVKPGVPELTEQEKVHLGEELSDVLIYLIRLADRCDIDLPTAALRKMKMNAQKYPADQVRGSSKKYNEYHESKTQ